MFALQADVPVTSSVTVLFAVISIGVLNCCEKFPFADSCNWNLTTGLPAVSSMILRIAPAKSEDPAMSVTRNLFPAPGAAWVASAFVAWVAVAEKPFPGILSIVL